MKIVSSQFRSAITSTRILQTVAQQKKRLLFAMRRVLYRPKFGIPCGSRMNDTDKSTCFGRGVSRVPDVMGVYQHFLAVGVRLRRVLTRPGGELEHRI